MANDLSTISFDDLIPGNAGPAPASDLSSVTFDDLVPAPPAPDQPKGWFEATAETARSALSDNAVARGFSSGLLAENPQNFGDAVEGFGHLAGSDWAIGQGRAIQDWARSANPQDFARRGSGIFDAKSVDDFLTSAGETFGSGIASTLPSAATGIGGAIAGGAVAGPAGAVAGGVAGAGATSYVQSFGELYGALKEAGVEPRRSAELARYGAVPIAALDVASLGRVASMFTGEARREVVRGLARRIAAAAGQGMATEGATEAAQEFLKDAVVAYETGQPLMTAERAKGWAEAGIGGAMVGGAMGAPAGVRAPARDAIDPNLPAPTRGDIESPIPTATIQRGKAKIDELLAKGLERASAPRPTDSGFAPAGYEPLYDEETGEQIGWHDPRTGDVRRAGALRIAPVPNAQEAAVGTATDEERAILRAGGIADEDIDVMSPAERRADIAALRRSGVMLPAMESDPSAVPAASPAAVSARSAPRAEEPSAEPASRDALRAEPPTADASDLSSISFDDLLPTRPTEADVRPIGVGGTATGGMVEPRRAVARPIDAPAAAPAPSAVAVAPAAAPTGDGSRAAPVRVDHPDHVEAAAARVDTAPTDGQKEAGNYQKGHLKLGGMDITIETPKDAERSGTAPDGTRWSVRMPAHYGYVKRSEGADGDQVDVYVGPEADTGRVYVFDQFDPKTGRFDEHKAVLGVRSIEDAQDLYDAGFSDGSGPRRRGGITEMSTDEFRTWAMSGDTSKPLGEAPTQQDERAKKTEEIAPEPQKAATNQVPTQQEGITATTTFAAAPEAPQKPRFDGLTSEGRRAVFKAAGYDNTKALIRSKVAWKYLTEAERAMFSVLPAGYETIPEIRPKPESSDSVVEPLAQEPKKPDGYGEGNKVFTADAAEKARAILRAKLKNQVSSGLDPEIVQAGITLAGYHIEAGARKFADYTRAMIADLGEEVRPYLRSWYEGVRYYPGFDAQGMSTATEIEAEGAYGTEPAVRAPEESVQPEAGAVPAGRAPAGAPETEGERAVEGAPRADRRGGRRGARSVRDAAPDQSERPEGDGGTDGLLPADSADRGGDRPERRRVRTAESVAEKAVKEVAEGRAARARKNYQITEDDRIGQGGPKEKVRANIEAIRTLKRIEDEKRQATPEEKRALVKFVGWGAFAQPIFDSRPRPEWKDERAAVFDLLTPEEIAAARKSTLNAHYTSEPVIRGMWDALAHLGFKGGRALEPSAGVGHFIGMTPEAVRDNTAWTAVELDTTTGRIAQLLYDGCDVNVQGFEDFKRPNDFFDLAISNVPFGDFTIRDTKRPGLLIHDYFFVKGLDLVRPGGLVAFITSSGTMDKLDKKARRLILDRADFLGAIRLPGGDRGAFAGNAGTEVTTDIIFLRKRGVNQEPRHAGDFLETKRIETQEGPTSINAYFAANRDMMLGEMRLVGSMYRANSPVLVGDATDIDKRIAKAAQKMEAGAMLPRQMPPRVEKAADLETGEIKEGAIYQKGGKAFRKVNGVGQELKLSAADAKKLPGFLAMRDAVNKLLAKQARGDRAGLEGLRKDLNKAYDAFVKEHGPINRVVETVQTRTDKKTGAVSTVTIRRLPNFTPFADDPDAYKTAAIEEYDEVSDRGRKAAIFTTDIVGAYQPPEVTGPADAIAVSLNERGKVDIPLIAERMGLSEAETISTLGDLVYEDPISGDWRTAGDYLSGDVVTALDQARAGAKSDPDRFARNVEALEKVQPTPLTRVDVRVNFGAPWVPTDVYEDFLRSIGGRQISVRMNPVTKTIQVAEGFFDSSAQGAYGTSRADAKEVVNAALKQTSFKIYDTDADGNAVVNEPATQEVLVKIAAIREAFAGNPEAGIEGWVWQDEARAERLEALYNASFNRLVPVVYDGSHLALPGLAKSIVNGNGETIPFGLRPHQKDAVWRVIQSGNTLLDHVVGAGKTFTMIAAGMEQKRLGLIQRPMYVVPNHMLEQFSREFYQAYPNAKLLVATKDQMTKDRRKEFAARVAADRWDGIIITHDAFGRIGMSAEASARYLNDEVARLQTAIDAAREEEGAKSRTVKEIEKAKEKIEARVEKLMNVERKDEGVTFEELGIDFLVVDEAHLFKNLRIATRHTRVKGIGKSASQRAEDLFIKIRTLEQSRPGRSTLFATGTPISNTMAEMYVMQRYLQNDTMVEYGVDEFDAWAATFGEITTQMELAPNGRTFQETTSFAKFVNIPELVALYSAVADVKTAEMLNLPRPTLRGGAIKVVEAEPSEAEEQYIAKLVERAAAMKGKRVEKGGDNMLKIVSEGRKVATDFRLLRPDAEINPDGKIAKAVDNLYRIWKSGKDPALAQIVFLDMGVPTAKKGAAPARPAGTRMEGDEAEDGADVESSVLYEAKFNLYEDIRERLVARGIPKEQIAFIHEATDDVKKGALFRKVRSGEVRILVGSTGKMGVGTNVQRKLIAMHHLDAPWKPAEVEQRDGRIIRQGNENREVDMFRYITKRSFDSFMWQALERKSKFIAQIKAGARGIRSAEDIDDPLPEAATLKAAASGDPRIMEHAELTKEVRDLENQKRNHDRGIQRAKAGLGTAREQLSILEKNAAALAADAAQIVDIAGGKFKVEFAFDRRGAMTDRRAAGDAARTFMVNSARSVYSQVPVEWSLGAIGGLRMRASVRRTSEGLGVTPFVEGQGTYSSREFLLTEDADPIALIGRWERILRDVPTMAAEMPDRVRAKRDEIGRLTNQAKDVAFPKNARLIEAKRRMIDLQAALLPKDPAKAVSADAPTQMGGAPLFSDASPAGWDEIGGLDPAPRLTEAELNEIGDIIARVSGLESFRRSDTIPIPANSPGAKAWGRIEAGRAAAFYNALSDTITVALDMPDGAGQRVAYHESFHRLQRQFLTDRERTVLAAESERLRDILRRTPGREDSADRMEQKEVEAEAFAIYSTRRVVPAGFPLRLRPILAKMDRIVRAVRNWLHGHGYRTYEDVFEAAARGDIARRTARGVVGTTAADDFSLMGSDFDGRGDTDEEALAFGRARLGMLQSFLGANRGLLSRVRAAASWDAVNESIDRWRFAFQDIVIDLKQVQREIVQSLGRGLAESENPYLAYELYEGRTGPRLERLHEDMIVPLMARLRDDDVSIDDLDDYLYARHAPERNARIAEINPALPEGGSGMTDEEAADIMARFHRSGKADAIEEVAALVDEIKNFALETRVESGLLSQEQADAWRATYEHYVPLRGFAEMDPEALDEQPRVGGTGVNVRGRESLRALGRESRAADILAHVILQAQEAIVRAERNRVGQALHELARSAPNRAFWTVDPVKRKAVWSNKLQRVVYQRVHALTRAEEDHTVFLKIDGQEHRVTFNMKNPRARRLAEGMRRLKGQDFGAVVRTLGAINRVLSALNTSYNPEFVVTNALKDIQTAAVNLQQYDVDGLVRSVIRDYRPALVASMKGAFGREGGDWGRWHREFTDAGGRTYWNSVENVQEIRARLEKDVAAASGGFSTLRAMKSIGRFVENANMGVENALRLATFKAAREAGMSAAAAASVARNVTVNFGRRGAYGPVMNSLYLFYNAGIQGTFAILGAMRSPRVRKIVAGIVAFGAMVTIWNSLAGDDDDDGEAFYDKIPDFDRQRNMIFVLPGTGGRFIKLPMPYGYNAFYGLGRTLMEGAFGRKPLDAAADAVTGFIDAFNPVGGSDNLLKIVSPTIVDPIVELYGNRDFAGRPIAPDKRQFGPEIPNAQRYWNSVNPAWRMVTDALTTLTGGDKVRPGAIDLSPEWLEYLFGVATGASGQFLSRSSGAIMKLGDPTSDMTWNDVPFARRIIGSKAPWVDKAAFYERTADIEQQRAYLKRYGADGDIAMARAVAEENRDKLGLEKAAGAARKALGEVRKARSAAMKARDRGQLDADAYRTRMLELKDRESDIVSHFNRLWMERVKQQR